MWGRKTTHDVGETAFGFLIPLGFKVDERWISGGDSFGDGWRLTFSSPNVRIVVQYLDMQFEVHFTRGGTTATYLEIDRDLFARRSGYHGNMFPLEKLERAVARIAGDIRAHYGGLLAGDDADWDRVARLRQTELPPQRIS